MSRRRKHTPPGRGQEARKGYATHPQRKWDDPAKPQTCGRCHGEGSYLLHGVLRLCQCVR